MLKIVTLIKNSQSCPKKTLGIMNKRKTQANNDIAELKRHVSVMIKNLNSESCNKKAGLLRFYARLAKILRLVVNKNKNSSEYIFSILTQKFLKCAKFLPVS